jgi:hypothetical protein
VARRPGHTPHATHPAARHHPAKPQTNETQTAPQTSETSTHAHPTHQAHTQVNHENADYPLGQDIQHRYGLELTQQSTLLSQRCQSGHAPWQIMLSQDSIRSRSFAKASSVTMGMSYCRALPALPERESGSAATSSRVRLVVGIGSSSWVDHAAAGRSVASCCCSCWSIRSSRSWRSARVNFHWNGFAVAL